LKQSKPSGLRSGERSVLKALIVTGHDGRLEAVTVAVTITENCGEEADGFRGRVGEETESLRVIVALLGRGPGWFGPCVVIFDLVPCGEPAENTAECSD
jgi:hypothetical protein